MVEVMDVVVGVVVVQMDEVGVVEVEAGGTNPVLLPIVGEAVLYVGPLITWHLSALTKAVGAHMDTMAIMANTIIIMAINPTTMATMAKMATMLKMHPLTVLGTIPSSMINLSSPQIQL